MLWKVVREEEMDYLCGKEWVPNSSRRWYRPLTPDNFTGFQPVNSRLLLLSHLRKLSYYNRQRWKDERRKRWSRCCSQTIGYGMRIVTTGTWDGRNSQKHCCKVSSWKHSICTMLRQHPPK